MNNLATLAQIVLPSQILEHFTIDGVEKTETEIHIHLDEAMDSGLREDPN